MKAALFLLADVFMIVVAFRFGLRFIRQYGNYLLGLEWMVVGTSGTNFLLWALLGGNEDSVLYDVAYFFDAFSRSVGITLILVLGLMAVTHRYKPSVPFDVAVFGLAVVGGLLLRGFYGKELEPGSTAFWVATFYVAVNLLAACFLAYFAKRLWDVGERRLSLWTAAVTAMACFIAITYDFFPLSFDDADRTIFYTAALTTWGAQGQVYFLGYRALHDHDTAAVTATALPQRASA
jgi:hypothetical protein